MMKNYELKTEYALQPEVDPSHDISAGLHRHLPILYDELGRDREKRWEMSWLLCIALVFGSLMIARAM